MTKIAFIWQGVLDPKVFHHWNDGLRVAMRILEKEYEVHYKEPWDEITEDIVLYWESPVTSQGQNAQHYNRVRNLPQKKILLFAGGLIQKEWIRGFDLLAVESRINEEECTNLGIPWFRAFGVNTEAFKPIPSEKKWDGMLQGTCASWKRQWLIGESLGEKGLLCGRGQDSDPFPFDECRRLGVTVLPEQSVEEVAKLISQSHCVVNTADFYGGGQRATLESLACGIPCIVMSDSPKNREYIEESGFGLVVEPNKEAIKTAVEYIKNNPQDFPPEKGVNYINSKWTEKHYAEALKIGINQCKEPQ